MTVVILEGTRVLARSKSIYCGLNLCTFYLLVAVVAVLVTMMMIRRRIEVKYKVQETEHYTHRVAFFWY